MFQFQPAVSESSVLKARIDSKSTDSPVEQPENKDVVNVSEDTPIDNVVEPEARANEEVTEEVEESENKEVSQAAQTDTDEDLYVEYKGREINLRDVEEWEQGHLRQSDYTRKTQELSESRKTFDTQQVDFNAKQIELSDLTAQMSAMIELDKPSAETLAEWREYEPEKLLEHQEKQAKFDKLLDSSKAITPTSTVDVQANKLSYGKPTLHGRIMASKLKRSLMI